MARILVAVDGTEFSRWALEHALGVMAQGDELILLRVCSLSLDPETGYALTDCSEAEAEASLTRLAEPLAHLEPPVRCLVASGDPASVIAEVARREHPRLLVMSTHKRRGADRFLHGSVAEHAARQAPCPAYLAPPGGNSLPRNTVVVPLDTSERAEDALLEARQLLSPGGQLVLVTATEGIVGDPESQEPLRRQLQRYLDGLVDRLRQVGVRSHSRVEESLAVPTILDAVRAEQADLVVMTTHGRSGPARWVLGSVAEETVRSCPCPVVLLGPASVPSPASGATPQL